MLPKVDFEIAPGAAVDLVAEFQGAADETAFLGVFKKMKRSLLIDQAKGFGVQIGPGPSPQIFNSEETRVVYLEEKHPRDWQKLYNPNGKFKVDPVLWDSYRIGSARELPFDDGKLDFVFSSHVFEHLHNPLGHLRHWHAKLKEGGKILAVVPSVLGCKDINSVSSSLESIRREYQNGVWDAPLEKYAYYLRIRGIEERAEDW